MGGLLEAVIFFLIYLAIICLVIYLVIWVLTSLGIPLPDMVLKIIWIIVALVAILMLVRLILPAARGSKLVELVTSLVT